MLPSNCNCAMVVFWLALIVGFLGSEFAQRRKIIPFAE
jgi:hypothetical protein